LILPAKTLSPIFLFIGFDSPVRKSSLVDDEPEVMTPSIGIISPGETPIISPPDRS